MRRSWTALWFCAGLALAQTRVPAPAPAAQPPAAGAKPAATARPPAVPSYKDLKYPPLRPIQTPKVDTSTLPNGMKLYLLEDHELPTVSGTALVRTGNLFDPQDKIGLASITGMVMRIGGTRDKTGDQLDEQLENMAASVESGIGETSATVSFSALKENTGEVLEIFKGRAHGPGVPPGQDRFCQEPVSQRHLAAQRRRCGNRAAGIHRI